MSEPKTLLQLAGADLAPAGLDRAALVLIDMQNEYLAGPVAVAGAKAAVAHARELLERARGLGAPIVHVAHKGRPGGLFDRDAERGAFAPGLEPAPGEEVVEKALPNAFAGTPLQSLLEKSGRRELILCGFMTHMCVSSTARAATDHGYRVTIDADACGTRDLPDGKGGAVAAALVHDVALAELADRFAIVVRDHRW